MKKEPNQSLEPTPLALLGVYLAAYLLALAVYNQRIPLDGDIRSSYIVASKDRTIRPD